jgi:hypothetical protein
VWRAAWESSHEFVGELRARFWVDCGVDRDDVVGVLDAMVGCRERYIDQAEVKGSVFVINVSWHLRRRPSSAGETGRPSCARSQFGAGTLGPDGTPVDLRWEGTGSRVRSRRRWRAS